MTMWIETSVDRRGSEGKCKNAARLIKRNGMGLLQIDGLGVPAIVPEMEPGSLVARAGRRGTLRSDPSGAAGPQP